MKHMLERLQPLGRALMLPIAVLPVAGIMLRMGQPDLLDIAFLAAAGAAIFDNLGLLFALGIAVGYARENHGAAGLAGLVCFIVATRGAETLIAIPPDALAGVPAELAGMAEASWRERAIAKLSVPIGILSGLAAGALYNRYASIRLPAYLAFFGGRRFVPIVAGLAGLGFALLFGLGYGAINAGVDGLSRSVVAAGPAGLFVYGAFNRLLIVTGLHHILNNVAWFILGDFGGATGDLNRFFAGDPAAGAFMTGFFPVMMFGLPAACLAMYHCARPERRKEVGGMLFSMALTSALTGVTEPIEFSFMFLAPVLYAIHAVLTGVSMALMDGLNVKLGFGFSAGLFDYALNFGKATNPLMLGPVGLGYAAIYYAAFRFAIMRFDLPTPGRDAVAIAPVAASAGPQGDTGGAYLAALGGAANLTQIATCTTRLRLKLRDQSKIDEAALRALGAKGVLRLSENDLQVVIGPEADLIAGEMREAAGPLKDAAPEFARQETKTAPHVETGPWIDALGGAANIRQMGSAHSRIWLDLARPDGLDEPALTGLGVRMVVRAGGDVQLLVPDADNIAAALQPA